MIGAWPVAPNSRQQVQPLQPEGTPEDHGLEISWILFLLGMVGILGPLGLLLYLLAF